MAVKQQTSYPIWAGVFTTVSASILIVLAIYVSFLTLGFPYSLPSAYIAYYVISSTINFATNVIGLIGGVMSLMRKNYTLAVVGVTVVLLNSISYAEYSIFQPLLSESIDFTSILYSLGGIATLVLSLVAIVLLAKSKAEFL